MKKLILSLMVVGSCAFAFTSCKSDASTPSEAVEAAVDSTAEAAEAAIDSTADAVEEVADSAKAAIDSMQAK